MSEHLATAGLLELWEATSGATPARRALSLLAAACPGTSAEDLAALPLGAASQLHLELHRRLFGDILEAAARCPHCGEELEVALAARELLGAPDEPPVPSEVSARVSAEGDELRLLARPLTTADLLAVETSGEVEDAARRLLAGCLLEARRGELAVAADELTDAEQTAVAEALAVALVAADPRAEIVLDLGCESCGGSFRQPLDPATFLAVEIEVAAHRLLRQVHVLARAYGWREADVLALSPQRRRIYLEMVGA